MAINYPVEVSVWSGRGLSAQECWADTGNNISISKCAGAAHCLRLISFNCIALHLLTIVVQLVLFGTDVQVRTFLCHFVNLQSGLRLCCNKGWHRTSSFCALLFLILQVPSQQLSSGILQLKLNLHHVQFKPMLQSCVL